MLRIREDDLSGAAVRSLVALHRAQAHANSPPGHSFAMDETGLRGPGITVWSAWQDAAISGIAALKLLPGGDGELKSMRTHPDFLRRGVAMALLDHVIAEARARGCRRLCLETGSGPAFDPALALYRKRGFLDGAAFSDYRQSSFNQFLHLAL